VVHAHAALASLAGVVLLSAVSAYLYLACTRHQPLRLGRIEIPVPRGRIAFAQIAVACADLLCAAAVLYVLLPQEAAISFAAFAGVYLIAIAPAPSAMCRAASACSKRCCCCSCSRCRRTGCSAPWWRIAPFTISRRSAWRSSCWARTSCGCTAGPRYDSCGLLEPCCRPSRLRPLRSPCSLRARYC